MLENSYENESLTFPTESEIEVMMLDRSIFLLLSTTLCPFFFMICSSRIQKVSQFLNVLIPYSLDSQMKSALVYCVQFFSYFYNAIFSIKNRYKNVRFY